MCSLTCIVIHFIKPMISTYFLVLTKKPHQANPSYNRVLSIPSCMTCICIFVRDTFIIEEESRQQNKMQAVS